MEDISIMATSKNLTNEQIDYLNTLHGVSDSKNWPSETKKKFGYWANANVGLSDSQWENWLLHASANDQRGKILTIGMNKLLWHLGLRGHRNEISNTQSPAIADYIAVNWDELTSNYSHLLTVSESADRDLCEIVGCEFMARGETVRRGTSTPSAGNRSYQPPAYVSAADKQRMAVEEAVAAERVKVAEATKAQETKEATEQPKATQPVKVEPAKVKELAKIKQLTTTK